MPFSTAPFLCLVAVALVPFIARAQTTANAVSYANTTSSPLRPPAHETRTALVVGTWTGPLALPGKALGVGVTISQTGEGLVAVLDIPGARISHHRLILAQRHDTLQLYDPVTEAHYACAPTLDGTQLVGLWQQVGLREPLVLRRGAPAPEMTSMRASRTTYATEWESGELQNGRPVGPWNYYRVTPDGQRALTRTYDHSSGRLVFAGADDDAFDAEVTPGIWERRVLTQSPWFIGRHDALAAYGAHVRYPPAAQRQKVEGKVLVSFVVDTLGRVSDPQVVRGLGSGCDEEALRVARTIPDSWTPGRIGTKAVAARQYVSFVFRLR